MLSMPTKYAWQTKLQLTKDDYVCFSMTMKFVKKTISLPEDVYQFAEKKANQLAAERGSAPNLSAVVRELLLKEKRKAETLPKAA